MEIPYMIVDEVKRIEKQSQQDSSITFILKPYFCNLNEYKISIIPIDKNTKIIQYKTAKFQCDTNTTYEKIIEYILSQIKREINHAISMNIELIGYIPDIDDKFENYDIFIMSKDVIIFQENFINDTESKVFDVLKEHFKPYFYISNTNIHI
jgi:hypothetical protein